MVTQGCGESCPVFLGARYEDWPLDDPKGQDEATVRRIIADIDGRVRRLLAELVPDHDLPPSVFEQAPQGLRRVSRPQLSAFCRDLPAYVGHVQAAHGGDELLQRGSRQRAGPGVDQVALAERHQGRDRGDPTRGRRARARPRCRPWRT